MLNPKLDDLDFFEHLCLTELLPKGKTHCHTFLKHLKENRCKTNNVVLFTKQYGPALSNGHSIWKENGEDDLLTNRSETINHIVRSLPKFFSRAHKSKCEALTSLLNMIKFHLLNFAVFTLN